MNVTQDLELWHLIANASLVVKAVMLLLLAVSFMSWMFIFRKWMAIRSARSQTEEFEREFWSGKDVNILYQGSVNNRHGIGSLERIFEVGYREFTKLRAQRGTDASTMVDGARRAMRATYQREMDQLESHLSFLASTGSVSPYVGLFGTVWGIMHAFRSLANVQQATLAQVAPGIGGADCHRDRPVCRDSGGGGLQPLLARHRPPRDPLRELHGRVLEHPAAADGATIVARLHSKRGAMSEINVVPYVDVMLVLLVIFMVTAPLVTPGVIDLPSVGKSSPPRVAPLEVVIKEDKSLSVRERDSAGRIVSDKPVTRADFPAIFKDPKVPVLVAGDKNVRYEAVLQVMDDLRAQGVERVGLQVRPKQ